MAAKIKQINRQTNKHFRIYVSRDYIIPILYPIIFFIFRCQILTMADKKEDAECSGSSAPDSVSENEASRDSSEPVSLISSDTTTSSDTLPPPIALVSVTSVMDPDLFTSPSHCTDAPESSSHNSCPIDPATHFTSSPKKCDVPESSEKSSLTSCPITPVVSLASDFHLPGSSSAFRPFITQATMPASTRQTDALSNISRHPSTNLPRLEETHASITRQPVVHTNTSQSNREITSSTELPDPITSTPVGRQLERPSFLGQPRQLSHDILSKVSSPLAQQSTAADFSGPVFLSPSCKIFQEFLN